MFVDDNPDKYKLSDPTLAKGEGPTQIYAEWSDHFVGATKNEFDKSPVAFFLRYFNRKL